MTTSSRIPAVIDALVSTLAAALSGVQVFDGQWVTEPDGDYLTVGWTPDREGPAGTQEFVGVATLARNEDIDIPCYADSYSGSTDNASRRNAAFALLAQVETTLRTDPNLGGAVPNPGWAQLGSYSIRQEQTEAGDAVGIVFHVNVITRI